MSSQSSRRVPRRPSLSQRLGTVLTAAQLIGVEHDGRTLAWCPACGVETGRRGAKLRRDGTKRVAVAPSGLGWRCHSCSAGGGSADLVAFARFRRPMSELSRDELRALGDHVDALTGDAAAASPRPALACVPPSAAEREACAKDADARRWARVCTDAADYVRDLLARTNTISEREAWDACEHFEPPPAARETGAIVWRGQRITWGELQAFWNISVLEAEDAYFAELRDSGDGET
jgi:hypothetical protein